MARCGVGLMDTASVSASHGDHPALEAATACAATDPTFQMTSSIAPSVVTIANTPARELGASVEQWSNHAFLMRGDSSNLACGALLRVDPPLPEDPPWGMHLLPRVGTSTVVGVVCRYQPAQIFAGISMIVATVSGVCSAIVIGTGPIAAPLYADGPALSFQGEGQPIATLLKIHRELQSYEEAGRLPNATIYFM